MRTLKESLTLYYIVMNSKEIIKKWSTRGGKYEMVLVKDEFGYSLKELTNGVVRGSSSFGSKTLEDCLKKIAKTITDSSTYDGINYKEVY